MLSTFSGQKNEGRKVKGGGCDVCHSLRAVVGQTFFGFSIPVHI
jgi:hypothetical protein